MLNNGQEIDDLLRRIADDYAEPSKKGELLIVLKLLKECIIINQTNDIEVALRALKVKFERDNITHLNLDNNEKIKEIKERYNL